MSNLTTARSARRRRAWKILGRLPESATPVLVAYLKADGTTVGVVTDLDAASQARVLRGLADAAEASLPKKPETVEEAVRS